jgi:hypothetical protein
MTYRSSLTSRVLDKSGSFNGFSSATSGLSYENKARLANEEARKASQARWRALRAAAA